jgi:hypothetical protein
MVQPRGPFLKAQKMANSSFGFSVETSAHLLAGQVTLLKEGLLIIGETL